MASAQPLIRDAVAPPSGPSMKQVVMALLLTTIVGGALGAATSAKPAPPAPHGTPPKEVVGEAAAISDASSNLFDLPPVVTNLANPHDAWVRLEVSMIFDSKVLKHPEVLGGQIADDLLAYMRTVSVAQIQGPVGLQNLRQDIDERAAIRSNGAVKGLVIRTLVIQ